MAGAGPSGPCVIVPVQALASAKSRLAEVLPDRDRAELVLAMLGDVLEAVRAAHDGPLLLVTPDEQYELAAAVVGATLLIDTGTGYNEAVRLALASSEVEAAGAAVVVPADQARAQATDLRSALDALDAHEVVVAPSLDGGTGLLGLRPPDAIEPAYGPGSAGAHEQAARSAGRSLAVLQLASLARDIDTVEDLADAEPPLGPRTAAFVAARRALLGG
ncbi:MAG: 2-phospho-L-lactate guanylyltransferase [Chloroflexi bacterium]|nr:2-phospho-L-lactate guanylyltransferase [Chloroflexota bacterium]